jgi:TolA-binding protein
MKSLLLSISLSLILLSACNSQPAPVPVATNVPVTLTMPVASATPIVSSSPTATSMPLPTPTFTPTPLPDQALREARQAMHDGDYSTAIQKYQALIDGAPSSDHLEEALIDRAYATARSGDPSSAIDLFTQFIDQHPKSDHVADAWFHLGELHFDRSAYTDAIAAYQNYLKLRPDVLADFVNEQIGDAYAQGGDAANAAKSYEEALAHASGISNVANLREKLALV